jgi:hypothetical protein
MKSIFSFHVVVDFFFVVAHHKLFESFHVAMYASLSTALLSFDYLEWIFVRALNSKVPHSNFNYNNSSTNSAVEDNRLMLVGWRRLEPDAKVGDK